VRSNLLDAKGVFTPEGYQPRDSKPLTEELNYVHILNHQLPEDIRVLGWCPVSEDFSARYVTTSEKEQACKSVLLHDFLEVKYLAKLPL